MSKDVLKLALEELMTEYCMERTSFAKRVDEIFKQALAAPVQEPVPAAIKTVVEAMQADPDYAWGWHCNIAMAFVDAGGDHYTGNQGAARFMKMLADVEPAHELPSPTPPAAPVQPLPFGVGGGLVAIKTLLSRDPCAHATVAIQMIDAILAEHSPQKTNTP
jgi:hypothetical protein